jgi:hypothetical protein
MAHALKITPERLESQGQRPDAAEILAEILAEEADRREGHLEVTSPDVPNEMAAEIKPHFREIQGRIAVASATHPGARLEGRWIFPDSPLDAHRWNNLIAKGYAARQVAQMLAVAWIIDRAQPAEPGDGAAGAI